MSQLHLHVSKDAFQPFPRGALIGAALLVALTIAVAASARLTGATIRTPPPAEAVASRELRFSDLPDGGVLVTDAARGTTVTVLAPGSNSFIRATLRTLANWRRRNGVGPQAPFRLLAGANGRLILQDPATGRSIELEAFGATNAAAFARLLGETHDRDHH